MGGLHCLQAGEDRGAALLQQVDAHQHIAVAGQRPSVAVIHLPPLGPQLDHKHQLQQPVINRCIIPQQLGVHNGQDVVHCDVHLHAHFPLLLPVWTGFVTFSWCLNVESELC